MSLKITSPAANAQVSGVITVSVQSTQKVEGIEGAAQTFSVSIDTTKLGSGSQKITVGNSAGESASVAVNVTIPESADGTMVKNTTDVIYDASGAVWSLRDVGGGNLKVYKGNSTVGYTDHAVALYYSGKSFYHCGQDGSWWKWDGTNWNAVSDPTIITLPFVGVVGHIGWYDKPIYQNDDTQIAMLKQFGRVAYRNDYTIGKYQRFNTFISKALPQGVVAYPVLLCDDGSSEQDAYNKGFALGQEVGNNVTNIPIIEVGNEEENGLLTGNYDGDQPNQYDNTLFCMKRGKILGMIAGIRSTNQKAKVILGAFTWLHYGFAQMLLQGTQPDGSTGHPKAVVDGIALHWYSNMGNPESAGWRKLNLFQIVAAWGYDLYVTEYGARSVECPDETSAVNYLTGSTCMGFFFDSAKRSAYRIKHAAQYCLANDGRTDGEGGSEGLYGMINQDGSKKGRFDPLVAWVKAHPVN